ncbi:MAG: hypothetical protein K6A74_09910 [Lachnospiraceae bacterium]|nr:hypothetical protein [Lachnospiraceae bacterium]
MKRIFLTILASCLIVFNMSLVSFASEIPSDGTDQLHDDHVDIVEKLDDVLSGISSLSSELDKDYYKNYVDDIETNQGLIKDKLKTSNDNEKTIIDNQEKILKALDEAADVSSGSVHTIDDVYGQLSDVNESLLAINNTVKILIAQEEESNLEVGLPADATYNYWILLKVYVSDNMLASIDGLDEGGYVYCLVNSLNAPTSHNINVWSSNGLLNGGVRLGVSTNGLIFYSPDLKRWYSSSVNYGFSIGSGTYQKVVWNCPSGVSSCVLVAYDCGPSMRSPSNPFSTDDGSMFTDLDEFLAEPMKVTRYEYELVNTLKEIEYIGLCLLGFAMTAIFAGFRRST